MSKNILAIDGDNLLHRAFYGTVNAPKHISEFGYPVNGVITFFQSINKTLRGSDYTHITIAWDIRHTLLKRYSILKEHDIHYKNREEGLTDEQKERRQQIRQQKVLCHNLLLELGIPSLVSSADMGIESDDILACISKHAKADRIDVFSNDKDMAQIIDERTRIINPVTGYIDWVNCSDRYGVDPERIVDLMCLTGDSVDNIPGVRGCGTKTAVKLLEEYGTLEAISENADLIKGAVGKTLRAKDHLPFDVLRSVIKLEQDAYPKKHEALSMKAMNLDNIREHAQSNSKRIIALKRKLNFATDSKELLYEIGI